MESVSPSRSANCVSLRAPTRSTHTNHAVIARFSEISPFHSVEKDGPHHCGQGVRVARIVYRCARGRAPLTQFTL